MPTRHHHIPFRAIRLSLTASLVASCLGTAHATEPVDIDIAAQPLAAAATKLAAQSGLTLLYSADLLKGKTAPRIVGKLTPQEALDKLLAGSGLRYQFVTADAVKIEAVPVGKVAELPPIEVSAPAIQDDTIGYQSTRSFAGTKTDTPLMETPVSVQVVPQQVLRDTQALTLPDAVNGTVSGVLGRSGGGILYDNFIIRGLPGSPFGDAFRNGLFNRADIYDISNVERVEIVKGPAAMLYGRIEPGGLVNYVTKRPLDTPYYAVQQQFGSWDLSRTSVDATGPLTPDGSLLYRFNGSYLDTESFRDFVSDQRTFLAPAVTWRPNREFELTIEAERKLSSFQPDIGIPAVAGRPAPIPLKRSLADGPDLESLESTLLAADWTWKFNEDWQLTQRYLHKDWSLSYNQILNQGLQADGRTLDRAASKSSSDPFHQGGYATNLDLNGQIEFAGMKHDLLIGTDYFRSEDRSRGLFTPVAPIDIYDPVYRQVDLDGLPAETNAGGFYRLEKWRGFYVQDQIRFGKAWHLLLGGRYDSVDSGTGFAGAGSSIADAKAGFVSLSNDAFSPRVGLLYEFNKHLSLYSSYSESFGANNGVSSTGQRFDPQSGDQIEVGMKFESPDRGLSGTVSVFDLTKSNLLTDDPASIDPAVQILAGKINNRGIEVDVSGEVNEQLKLLATYAYIDAQYTEDYDGLKGNRLENVPEHQGSVWGVWQFDPSWRAGLGLIAVDSRSADPENTAVLPGYARFDAMLGYDLRVASQRVQLQLNVQNLLDERYYANSGGSSNNVIPGAPINVLGSMRVEF